MMAAIIVVALTLASILDVPSASVLIGAAGSLAVAIGTYLVARRQGSGRIATSDAATLWAESQAMRRELREEVVELRSALALARTELASATTEIQALRAEVQTLRHTVATLRRAPRGNPPQAPD